MAIASSWTCARVSSQCSAANRQAAACCRTEFSETGRARCTATLHAEHCHAAHLRLHRRATMRGGYRTLYRRSAQNRACGRRDRRGAAPEESMSCTVSEKNRVSRHTPSTACGRTHVRVRAGDRWRSGRRAGRGATDGYRSRPKTAGRLSIWVARVRRWGRHP